MSTSWILLCNTTKGTGLSGEVSASVNSRGPAKGDTIYLYREANPDADPGIYAVGEATFFLKGELGIRLNSEVLSNKRQFIKQTTLLRDPGLGFKEGFVERNNGAFRLSATEARRLHLLAKKAGKDYDLVDSMRCLLAYEECFRRGLGIDNSEPVINAALETGRLMTSVAFKLANFRSLDPRTDSAGFVGVAAVDRTAWDKYYMPAEKRIDMQRLRSDLAEIEFIDPDLFIVGEDEEQADFVAPLNDEDRRQLFARRIRRGQSRFRKALLTLYGNQCAFSGVTEDGVLEACHVLSHAETGNNQLDNGLILRADIHTLFDLRLITVANDGLTVRVSPEVSDEEYTGLNLKKQARASASEQHRDILAQRNRDITWLS